MPEHISNSRRVLAVALDKEQKHLGQLIKDLTGSAPEPQAATPSLAGTSHDLSLKTPYYSATVPIWLDLIASPAEWAESFLSDEASEVLAVLGGLILVFALPPPPVPELPTPEVPTTDSETRASGAKPASTPADGVRDLIRHVGRMVKTGLGGWEWDGVGLAVGVGPGTDVEEWDELCAEAGLEFVHLSGRKSEPNEFGEKTGLSRLVEALEANDWAQGDDTALSDFDDFQEATEADPVDPSELDPENMDFGFDRADFEGLKAAIWTSGQREDDGPVDVKPSETEGGDVGKQGEGLEEKDVAKMESMMHQLQLARSAGEGMRPEQRRRMAARAVEEVMREI